MECQECEITICIELKKPTGDKFIDEFYNTYCCNHVGYNYQEICKNCIEAGN
tara:strand:- start:959 stop:1114 length:156 start_codon:yes stop_codon:yes gene_type:complete